MNEPPRRRKRKTTKGKVTRVDTSEPAQRKSSVTRVDTSVGGAGNAPQFTPTGGGGTRLDAEETALLDQARDRSWHMLSRLHTLMKGVMLHGADHPSAQKPAAQFIQALAEMPPPFVAQFVAGAVFVDRQLVPLDFNHYERCVEVTRALDTLHAHELSFDDTLTIEGALQLGTAMAAGTRGDPDGLKGVSIDGVSWRDIPHAQSGIDAEGVDPEVAAVTHTLLGLGVVEQIAEMPGEPWPWNMGLAVIRRLEKGLTANEEASMRVVEFAPEGWPIARRALSACQLVLQVLTKLDVEPNNRRAAAHATLALCLQGLEQRSGHGVDVAADGLADRMTAAPIQASSGIAPQCLLVASLAYLMGSSMRNHKSIVSLKVVDLIELVYEMERGRCPANAPFDLTRADLLAQSLGQPGVAQEWLQAMIKICGAVPVGAHVQLADGRVGIVMEPGPPHNPWCPTVFVDGARVAAQQPVMLVPPNRLQLVH